MIYKIVYRNTQFNIWLLSKLKTKNLQKNLNIFINNNIMVSKC